MDYSVFVKQLIKDMTLEEKIRQTQMLDDFNDLLEEGEFSPRKADEVLKGNSIGCVQIFQLGDLKKTPEQLRRLIDDLQDYLKKHTRHGIPALVVAESLHGVIAWDTTVFPQIIGLSSSWNEDLVGRVAECISEEAESLGVNQVLAPDLDLARDPRWGRVEETYGEDPYLTGVMGSRYVRGIQKNRRVASTLKHYVAHGTPESGVNLSPVNAGERQVRELYLPPFAEAMKEKPLSVMPAYSEIDGIPCSCSSRVLTDILREELGFDGYTISDYMAVEMLHNFHHTAETPAEAGRQALEAGMDLEAPNEYGFGQKMLELVQKGEISMEALDRAVERILSVKARLGLFEENVPESVRRVDMEAHRKLALKAAEESIVLLKNENHILPLKETVKNIAVIGPNAAIAQLGDYCSAGGTGVSLLEGLKELYSGTLHYVQGSTLYQKIPGGIREAVEAAEKSDVVLLALGGSGSTYGGIGWGEDGCGEVTSGEGFDSVDIRLSVPQLELAEHVLDTGKPVILILEDGRPCAIPEIYDRAGAVIQAWYPGQEGGRALAEILFGKVNPSGKLTVSIPKHVGQIPVCYNRKPSTGGFYHRPGTPEKPGRDYTTMDTKPYYSFGYGLSYTRFAYSNLEIQEQKNGAVVRVDVQNVGEVPGKEVVQLYINDEVSSVTTPVKALKGFCKVDLEPGQKRTVTFTLDAQSLYLIDRDMKKRVEAGWFEVFVGDQKGRFYVQGVEL